MSDSISISLLSYAADAIAETRNGLSGSKVVTYCNAYAVDHNVEIPHPVYPFHCSSKRTALLENLRAFPARVQYQLLMELCSDPLLADNGEVQKVREKIQKHCAHLADATRIHPIAPSEPAAASTIETSVAAVAPAPVAASVEATVPTRPYDIFLSYSHDDEKWMNLVRKHLNIFDRMGQIRKWWDRKLIPGTELDPSITKRLASADIVILFVSASFIDSDYCYEVEMQQALRQHEEGRSVVVPVIVRHCAWQKAPFGRLLALPRDGRPIAAWGDHDEAAKDVAEGVMRIVAELQKRQQNATSS